MHLLYVFFGSLGTLFNILHCPFFEDLSEIQTCLAWKQGCAIIPLLSQISILMSRYCKILWYWGVIDIAVFWIWLLLLILTLQKNFLHYHYWYWYCKIQPTSINIDIGIAKQNERNVFLKLVLQNVLSIRMCKIYT